MKRNGAKLGKESERLLREYAHLVEGNHEIYEEKEQESNEKIRRERNGKEGSSTDNGDGHSQIQEEYQQEGNNKEWEHRLEMMDGATYEEEPESEKERSKENQKE